MQEPWVIGLAFFGIFVVWMLWQAVENALFGGLFALIFGSLENWWKTRHRRP